MTESAGEPARDQPHPDIEQKARAGEQAFQSARDQNVFEIHYHNEVVPAEWRAVGSTLREIVETQRNVVKAQLAVAEAQQLIRGHHGLIDLLLQLLGNMQQASLKLSAKRAELNGQLQHQVRTNAGLVARLHDAERRLEETERARDDIARRLAEAQRQQAEARRLKDQALDQLRRCRRQMDELRRTAQAADGAVGGSGPPSDDPDPEAGPLMGGTDQWAVADALRSVDDVLEHEAGHLVKLHGIVTEYPRDEYPSEVAPPEPRLAPPPEPTVPAARMGAPERREMTVAMPSVGESVHEGTVVRWQRREGDYVNVDEPLVDVATDKVDIEIPAPTSGYLREIIVYEDETVPIGAVLCAIEIAVAEKPRKVP